MQTFSLFTTDTRYSVPTLTLVTAEDEAGAIALAQNNLAQSEFHIAVELLEGERRFYQEVRPKIAPTDQRPRASRPSIEHEHVGRELGDGPPLSQVEHGLESSWDILDRVGL